MNDRDVAQYLLTNPGFFDNHAELLAAIRLTNPHGKAAVSLPERQMTMLREKNKYLERQLAELLRHSRENDSLAAKFNDWAMRVMAERDIHALPSAIACGLTEIFDVPQVALRIWNVAAAYEHAEFARRASEEVRIFANNLTVPYCGANTGFEAAQWLEPVKVATDAAAGKSHENAADSHGKAQSLALIALRDARDDGNAFGLLVMGSPDPRRFRESMATDFLAQIGSLASAALSRLLEPVIG